MAPHTSSCCLRSQCGSILAWRTRQYHPDLQVRHLLQRRGENEVYTHSQQQQQHSSRCLLASLEALYVAAGLLCQ